MAHFERCFEFIEGAILKGGGCLVVRCASPGPSVAPTDSLGPADTVSARSAALLRGEEQERDGNPCLPHEDAALHGSGELRDRILCICVIWARAGAGSGPGP